MPIKSYRDLDVYKRAKGLIVPMHRLASALPAREQSDLSDQIRRASKSVVANIVEGYSHIETPAKAKQHWRVAMGSADEMVEHLDTAVVLQYVPEATCKPYMEQYTVVAKQLYRLIHNWQKF